ncbi:MULTISPECIES: signal peptidase I [Pimelobacter]|uniref:signal peptidase I n=1 Tax=Pimelobacter TaxID=2044 RepID=UPI001C0401F1|nr:MULTISPECIES: signal peptidase I [Pimelobacter]MBU2698633.1 signal peptidase I [Pimelobacter sp. 30-1]UUW89302.1 signal peptidase I [Pimelobacter simplex]UUW93130.1 signal peptidase I [Pimelobacter simplex]
MTNDETPPEPADQAPAAAEDDAADDAAPAKRERKHLPVWQESILLLVVALGLAIVIKALFVQAFYIPSESMEPGLVKNDRILVQKVSYWFGGSPQRGDVVVFEDPGQWLGPSDEQGPTGIANLLSKVGLYPTGGHLVKRVIGTEGDVIECCDKQGRIKINGKPLDEPYLNKDPGECHAALFDDWSITKDSALSGPCDWIIGPIPKGKLLVLGDNRAHSADSRAHLCSPDDDPCTQSPWVDKSLVVGKVFTLIWPRDRWRWITRPDTFDAIPDSPPADLVKKAEKADAVPGT